MFLCSNNNTFKRKTEEHFCLCVWEEGQKGVGVVAVVVDMWVCWLVLWQKGVLKQPIQHIANEPNTSSHKNNMLGHKFNATNIEHSLNFYSLHGFRAKCETDWWRMVAEGDRRHARILWLTHSISLSPSRGSSGKRNREMRKNEIEVEWRGQRDR